jgi:hypothetical protein
MPFSNATESCAELSMSLARINSAAEFEALKQMTGEPNLRHPSYFSSQCLSGPTGGLWIGAGNPGGSSCADAADCSGQFEWISDNSAIAADPWWTGGMKAVASDSKCVFVNGQQSFQLTGIKCDGAE